MKAKLIALLMFLAVGLASAETITTNGVFYVNAPTECHLIAQDGSTATNALASGHTYMVGNALAELHISTDSDIYLGGTAMLEAQSNSVFSIDVFDQEVKNINSEPSKAQFGYHNIGVTLINGDFSLIYPTNTPNSSFTVSTALTSYELNGGKYFFRVSDKSVVAYVFDGSMTVHGDNNKVSKTSKGNLALAIPFSDPSSGIPDRIMSSVKPLNSTNTTFVNPIVKAEGKFSNVEFCVVNGRVVGISMK